ncbi:uncharacterized protein G2W53_039795 [Senna tora]|uniref:Uncharacterized protein n=1 Tax=Senna tora TaxID=362788 RepID=A0A834W8B1_9FABA|nr:uncharacterized protein G2W53_039795 [Senna tora]
MTTSFHLLPTHTVRREQKQKWTSCLNQSENRSTAVVGRRRWLCRWTGSLLRLLLQHRIWYVKQYFPIPLAQYYQNIRNYYKGCCLAKKEVDLNHQHQERREQHNDSSSMVMDVCWLFTTSFFSCSAISEFNF